MIEEMSAPLNSAHHPAIQSALDAYVEAAPASVQEAGAVLQILLREIYDSPEPAAWHFSRLTGDGFPVEFAFTTTDVDIRYTAEIADLRIPADERLVLACQRLRLLGQPEIPASLLELLSQAQKDKVLSYGAWVGGRHSPQGNTFKLYTELPEMALEHYQPLLESLQIPWPHLADRPLSPRMFGYNLTSGRVEVYYRVPKLEVYHLARLTAPCQLSERSCELQHFLEKAYGYPLFEKLPGGSVGISYSYSPDRSSAIFTLFMFARTFWGGDASIRRKLSILAEKYGWDVTLYQRITAPLAARNTWNTYHGLLGFVMAPGTPISISLGVRPWSS